MNDKILKITLLLLLFKLQLLYGQRESIYLKFDSNSKDVYAYENGSGHTVKELVYQKHQKDNGDMVFYIKGQMFVHDKTKMDKKQCDFSKLSYIKLLAPDEVILYVVKVQEKYPMWYKYPSTEYPKIYIVEKLSNQLIDLIEVNWQYYIE